MKIIPEEIPDHDILCAGFPCQPFSLAGVSKKNSLGRAHGFECETQGTLFFDVEKIIEARKPKFFVLENVKNLKSHDKGKTFAVIIRTLDRLGYWIADISDSGKDINEAIESVRNRSPEPAIIDAVNYIPQHRERIVLVGVRKDIAHNGLTLRNLPEPEIKPTLKDLLCKDVPSNYTLTPNLWAYLYSYAIKHQVKGNGFGFGLVDPENPNATTRTLSARYYKDGSEILINHMGLEPEYLRNAIPGCTGKIRERIDFIAQKLKTFRQQNPDGSDAELVAFEKEAEEKYNHLHGRWPSSDIFDPCYKTPRRLTPQECARLQEFPDQWCSDLASENPTEEEIDRWVAIFEEYRKAVKPESRPKSRKMVQKWLQDPYRDAAEYRLWGNGICLNVAVFVLAGIVWADL